MEELDNAALTHAQYAAAFRVMSDLRRGCDPDALRELGMAVTWDEVEAEVANAQEAAAALKRHAHDRGDGIDWSLTGYALYAAVRDARRGQQVRSS